MAGGRVTTHAAVRAALAWSREVITVHATDDFDDAVALADHVDVVVVDVELLAEVGLYAAVSALRSAAAGPEVVAAAAEATRPSSPRRWRRARGPSWSWAPTSVRPATRSRPRSTAAA